MDHFPQDCCILAPGGGFTAGELSAMVLDGVLVPVFGQAYRPVAVPDSAALRAAALAGHVPAALAGRTALGGLSAAWVYGCAPPPSTICLLVGSGHRCSALPARSGCVLHEVRLATFDVESRGGALVTVALRTAVDVAIHVPPATARPVLAAMAASAVLDCPLGRIRDAVAAATHIPGKRRAKELLEGMLDGGRGTRPRDRR